MQNNTLVTDSGRLSSSVNIQVLRAHPILLSCLLLFIIGHLVDSIWNSRFFKDPSRPSVVPYWIPWLGSAISIGLDTDGFIAKNIRRFGPAFFVDTIGVRFLYITTREPIKWALKQPRNISIKGVEYEALQIIFGISEPAARVETSQSTAFKILSRDMAKWTIRPTLEQFHHFFKAVLNDFISNYSPQEMLSGKIIDFADVFSPLIYRAFSKAALGDAYPGEPFWHDHNKFHDAFPLLFSGLPESWAKSGIQARQNLSQEVLKHLKTHMQNDDPTSHSSPLFMKVVAKVLGLESDMSMEDAAKMVNLYMFAGDNIGIGSFWIISRLLGHPGLYEKVRKEADVAFATYTARKPTITFVDADGIEHERPTRFSDFLVDLPALDRSFPLLSSVFQEMVRYHGKQMFNRRAEVDVEIALNPEEPEKKLLIRKGDRIILFMRPTHHDPAVFKDPYVFKPERFIDISDQGATDIMSTDGSKNAFMLPFGFGTTVCPGRYLASFQIKNVVLCLLRTFDIEYVGVTGLSRFIGERGPGMDKTIPKQNLATFGTPLGMPFGDLRVRLKLRSDGGL
ncbi:hypothetical protein VKT23_009315 [Stygiomarasmius scandens]|uniref:Cytochrome P450 n=1 Tax=Marasmiellus scandens TaxID=2682957 RepID=A0ABR1JHF9_9AGAR